MNLDLLMPIKGETISQPVIVHLSADSWANTLQDEVELEVHVHYNTFDEHRYALIPQSWLRAARDQKVFEHSDWFFGKARSLYIQLPEYNGKSWKYDNGSFILQLD